MSISRISVLLVKRGLGYRIYLNFIGTVLATEDTLTYNVSDNQLCKQLTYTELDIVLATKNTLIYSVSQLYVSS